MEPEEGFCRFSKVPQFDNTLCLSIKECSKCYHLKAPEATVPLVLSTGNGLPRTGQHVRASPCNQTELLAKELLPHSSLKEA